MEIEGRIDHIIYGLNMCIANANLRSDDYDAGYVGAIKKEVEKLRDDFLAENARLHQVAEITNDTMRRIIDEANTESDQFIAPESEPYILMEYKPAPLTLSECGAIPDSMPAQQSPAVEVPDNFNGDDLKLIECAKALLELDAKGALVPHGLGGHARTIIASFVSRLSCQSPCITEQDAREPSHWLNSQAKNSVISNASKKSEGCEDLYRNWDTPLWKSDTSEINLKSLCVDFAEFYDEDNAVNMVGDWMNNRGRALLNKLNGDKNGQ